MEKKAFSLIVCCFLFVGMVGCDSMTTVVQESKALQKSGRFAESIGMLETETAKKPNNREANYLLGLAYLNTGRLESAHSIFSVAVSTQEDAKQRAFLKKEIAKAYRDAFYRYLANVDPAERQKARLLLAAVPLYNSDPELMEGIKKHLLKSGSQYVNKYALPRADEHFAYLYSLDKGSGPLIADAYLNAFLSDEEKDEEFKTVLINRAIVFSKNTKIQKAFSEYYFGLSQKAESTERALTYLEIANRHGNLFASELVAKKKQFELEKMLDLVKKNEEKFGKAQHVMLKKQGELISAGTIPKVSRIRYFSLHNFKIYFSDDDVETWKEAKTSEGRVKVWDNKEMNIKFELASLPTEIYYWVEKL